MARLAKFFSAITNAIPAPASDAAIAASLALQFITSLDLAKRSEILPGLRQVHWDLVIVDEAHRMSAADKSHKSLRYRLGELLRDSSDHILLLTATPHKGDPVNFSLFLQLLDADVYADVKSIREAMDRRRAPCGRLTQGAGG
jgi:superfamily II DNA or RNA helicase